MCGVIQVQHVLRECPEARRCPPRHRLGRAQPSIARVLDEPIAVLEAQDHVIVTCNQPRPLHDGYANFEDRRLAAKKRIERKRVTLVGG